MNRIKFSIAIIIIFFSVSQSYSQLKYSIGPFIGATIPAGDYSGTTIDYYNGIHYGLSSGVDVGAIFKIRLPVLAIRVTASYSQLKNTGVAVINEPDSYIEVRQSLFTISAGPEFLFNIPQSPIKPYAGVDLLLTSFNGETTFLYVPRVNNGTFSMSSTTRLGLGLGAGVEFGLGNKYSLDLGLRYNIHNLFGKNFTASDVRTTSYLYLNDAADPLYPIDPDHHPILSNRSISTLNIYLGFLFNL
jgi:opacity protein-like surface antigen